MFDDVVMIYVIGIMMDLEFIQDIVKKYVYFVGFLDWFEWFFYFVLVEILKDKGCK